MLANKNYPAEFWYKNMTMTANVWEASKNNSIEKLIFIMPGCTYPSNASSPMVEESLWEGYPDEFPAPGALAKKMGLVASYAYKKQYGLSSCVLIPGNLYGEHDHFGHENSHVIPAIITRMHKAKKDKVKEILYRLRVAIYS
jgi:GDP-L-fucose synthase